MLDGFARSITYLRISITDRCNYRCRYCMPDGGIEKCAHEDICSLEGLRDMAAAAVRCGVKKIRVTGGEPLVRRGAVDFCRMLSEIPGVEELCVTTNGSRWIVSFSIKTCRKYVTNRLKSWMLIGGTSPSIRQLLKVYVSDKCCNPCLRSWPRRTRNSSIMC